MPSRTHLINTRKHIAFLLITLAILSFIYFQIQSGLYFIHANVNEEKPVVDKNTAKLLVLADGLAKLGLHDSAIETYCYILNSQPMNNQTIDARFSLLSNLSRYDEAIKTYDVVLQLPDDCLIQLAELSIKTYDVVLQLDPNNKKALTNIAKVYEKSGQFNKALDTYDKILSFYILDNQALSDKLNLLAKLERYDEELQLFDKILEKYPDNAFVLKNKFQLFTKLEQYDEAYAVYTKMVEVVPSSAYYDIDLASILEKAQRYEEALKIYDNLIEKTSSQQAWSLRHNLIQNMYVQAGLTERLQPFFESAKLFEIENKFEEAVQSYEKILNIDRYNLEALTGKIRNLIKNEEFEKASDTYKQIFKKYELEFKRLEGINFKEAYRVQSDYFNALHSLADMHESKSDYSDALKSYNTIVAIDQFNILGLRGQAEMLEKLERYNEALPVYERLNALQPNNAEYIKKIELLQNIIANQTLLP